MPAREVEKVENSIRRGGRGENSSRNRGEKLAEGREVGNKKFHAETLRRSPSDKDAEGKRGQGLGARGWQKDGRLGQALKGRDPTEIKIIGYVKRSATQEHRLNMRYRRLKFDGGHYFFTVVTYARRPLFSKPENVELLRSAFRHVKSGHPFKIEAIVILPDHIHCVWKLPPEDHAFSLRWRLIKEHFTKHCRAVHRGMRSRRRIQKREQAVWQRRFWEHLIRSDNDLTNHVDYIHWNPVKHGYVAAPQDWPYSSIHFYIKLGLFDIEVNGERKIEFGEDFGME